MVSDRRRKANQRFSSSYMLVCCDSEQGKWNKVLVLLFLLSTSEIQLQMPRKFKCMILLLDTFKIRIFDRNSEFSSSISRNGSRENVFTKIARAKRQCAAMPPHGRRAAMNFSYLFFFKKKTTAARSQQQHTVAFFLFLLKNHLNIIFV